MSRLYPIHWKAFEKFLFKMGCEFVSQKGSHRKYYKAGIARPIIVTVHGKGELPKEHIKSNLHTLGMSVEQYLDLIETF